MVRWEISSVKIQLEQLCAAVRSTWTRISLAYHQPLVEGQEENQRWQNCGEIQFKELHMKLVLSVQSVCERVNLYWKYKEFYWWSSQVYQSYRATSAGRFDRKAEGAGTSKIEEENLERMCCSMRVQLWNTGAICISLMQSHHRRDGRCHAHPWDVSHKAGFVHPHVHTIHPKTALSPLIAWCFKQACIEKGKREREKLERERTKDRDVSVLACDGKVSNHDLYMIHGTLLCGCHL